MERTAPDLKEARNFFYLAQVFDVLLDPSKNIVDDTSLQRLLEYCKEIFSQEDILQQEDGLTSVLDFCEACCSREVDTFDPCALTFALQLIKSMSTNQKNLSHMMTVSGNSEHQVSEGRLLVRLLKRASRDDFFSDPCMKEAWLCTLLYVNERTEFISICKDADVLRVGLSLLKDTSMFVVAAAQKLLAKVILIYYLKNAATGTKLHDTKQLESDPVEQGCQPDSEEKCGGSIESIDQSKHVEPENDRSCVQSNGGDGSFRQKGEEEKLTPGTDNSCKRNISELIDGEGTGFLSTSNAHGACSHKKAKLDAFPCKDEEGIEIKEVCVGLMESKDVGTVLACLLLDLNSESETKIMCSIGVFRCLLKDSLPGKEPDSSVLQLCHDVGIVTRCRKLLQREGPVSNKLAEDIVAFLGLLLHSESQACSSVSSVHLSDLESLPYDMIKRGIIRPALHLASSVVKLSSTLTQRSQEDTVTTMNTALSVILSPLCVISDQTPLSTDFELDLGVTEEMNKTMSDGKRALPIVCTALSTLQGLVQEDCQSSCVSPHDVFHLAVRVFLAVTTDLGRTNGQSGSLLPPYRSLIGSKRIMISLLGLTQASLGVTSSVDDIWNLLEILNRVLQNPDADHKVIQKTLTVVPFLLPLAVAPKAEDQLPPSPDRDTLLCDFGYALQKRMCNIEWEVRDSAITCVWKLLQEKSDGANEWLKRNNLHKRLWESLADSESYVRSTTLQALPALVSCKDLWHDVISDANISQADVIAQVTTVIQTDSEAFARRSAMDCLLVWLSHEEWVQTSIHHSLISTSAKDKASRASTSGQVSSTAGCVTQSGSCQDEAPVTAGLVTHTDTCKGPSASGDAFDDSAGDHIRDILQQEHFDTQSMDGVPSGLDQEMRSGNGGSRTVGDMVLDVVAIAMLDFDWEVKLGALKFYELLMTRYIPGFEMAETSVEASNTEILICRERVRTNIGNGQETVVGQRKRFLSNSRCLKMLLLASRDEDVSVACRVCLMLQQLQETLASLRESKDALLVTCAGDVGDQSDRPRVGGIMKGTGDSTNSFPSTGHEDFQSLSGSNSVAVNHPEASSSSTTSSESSDKKDISRSPKCHAVEERNESISSLIGQLFDSDWTALLKVREKDTVEGPVSLMMDIIAAADDKDGNLLDCY